jgi:hypothetical protein
LDELRRTESRLSDLIFRISDLRFPGLTLETEQELPVGFFHDIGLYTFGGITAGTRLQIKMVRVQGTDDLAIPHKTFGEWTLSMRTEILRRKKFAVALPEDRDLLSGNDITAALSHRDGLSATQMQAR